MASNLWDDGKLHQAKRIPLNGQGHDRWFDPDDPFGLSHLGGLLRGGELENDMRHVLSMRLSADRLAGNAPWRQRAQELPAGQG